MSDQWGWLIKFVHTPYTNTPYTPYTPPPVWTEFKQLSYLSFESDKLENYDFIYFELDMSFIPSIYKFFSNNNTIHFCWLGGGAWFKALVIMNFHLFHLFWTRYMNFLAIISVFQSFWSFPNDKSFYHFFYEGVAWFFHLFHLFWTRYDLYTNYFVFQSFWSFP